MKVFTFRFLTLLALTILSVGGANANLRASYTASSSSEDIPTISSSRRLQSSSKDVPAISTSRKLQSSSEDIPTISSARKLTSLTQDDKDRCYGIMDDTAVDESIDNDRFVEFLNSMTSGYLTENGITSFNDLSPQLKFAYNTLSCQCTALGGAEDCCEEDKAALFVEGADGKQVSVEQTNYLIDICKTLMATIESEGWDMSPPDEEELEQELPAQRISPQRLSTGQIIGLSVGIPLLVMITTLFMFFCRRDKENQPEEDEERDGEDNKLADVEKRGYVDEEDLAVGTMLTTEDSTEVEA